MPCITVSSIAAPMMVMNTVGAALFMRILLDKRAMFEKYFGIFCYCFAEGRRVERKFCVRGFNSERYEGGAGVISGLDIGAVAITDREKLLAFTVVLATITIYRATISSGYTLKAVKPEVVLCR